MRVSIHPLFLLFIFVSLISGLFFTALLLFFAVIIHESSHAIVAAHFGVKTKRLRLLPFGAQIEMDIAFLPANQKVLILLAGSFGNMAFALLLSGALWLFPGLFMVWYGLIITNAGVAILNLLPIYPLDGGKIMHLLFGKRTQKVLKHLSSIFFILCLVASILVTFNAQLIILSVTMLLMINLEFGQSELGSRFKIFSQKTKVQDIAITSKITLFEAYKLVSPKHFTRFIITDKSNQIIYENELERLLTAHCIDTSIQNVYFAQF